MERKEIPQVLCYIVKNLQYFTYSIIILNYFNGLQMYSGAVLNEDKEHLGMGSFKFDA
jgi:hypothetical protein